MRRPSFIEVLRCWLNKDNSCDSQDTMSERRFGTNIKNRA